MTRACVVLPRLRLSAVLSVVMTSLHAIALHGEATLAGVGQRLRPRLLRASATSFQTEERIEKN